MGLDLSNTATKLLTKLASNSHVKLKRTTGATTDPVLGTTTGGATEVINLVAAVKMVDSSLVDNVRVLASDRQFTCDKAIEPLMTDLVLIPDASGNDKEFRIIQIMESNHAGIVQVYKVVCRG